ncbi:MAG: glycosyltransferase [Nitrospira sp.]|nr:glycosyltransferase [Nitrospira sp.]
MRILHLGNAYFQESFRLLGHDVKWAGYHRTADIPLTRSLLDARSLLTQLPPHWYPDLIVLGDESTQPLVLGLETLPVPVVWYAIDSHIHANWHMHYAAAFDVILVAQKDWVPAYQLDGDRQHVSWMPLFCQGSHDLGFAREIPLSFIGTLDAARNPDRVDLILRLQTQYPIVVQSGPYDEIFNRSMMVLNQSVANDVNLRTFEAMACGALLLTERVGNGFSDLFQDRTHCALYEKGNVDHIIEITDYYRAHPAERKAIARQGYEAVMAAHTSLHRAQALLDTVARQPLHEFVAKRQMRQAPIRWSLASVYESAARTYDQAAARAGEDIRRHHFLKISEQYDTLARTIRGQLNPFVAA